MLISLWSRSNNLCPIFCVCWCCDVCFVVASKASSSKATAKAPKKHATRKRKHSNYNPDIYVNQEAYEAYLDIFKDLTIMVECEVGVQLFRDTIVHTALRDHGWEPIFLNFWKNPVEELVWEFYSNLRSSGKCLKGFVRGVQFEITPIEISNITDIKLILGIDILWYETHQYPSISTVAQFLGTRLRSSILSLKTNSLFVEYRCLLTILGFNLFPIDHFSSISNSRDQFLYDLLKGNSIDICSHIYLCIRQQCSRTSTWNDLQFPIIVMKISDHFRVPCPEKLTRLYRASTINVSTIARICAQIKKRSTSKKKPFKGKEKVTPIASIRLRWWNWVHGCRRHPSTNWNAWHSR